MNRIRIGAICLSLISATTALGACSGSTTATSNPPIVFVPGLGMSALSVNVSDASSFHFLVPAMTSPELLPPPATSALEYSLESGLAEVDVDKVHAWLALTIDDQGTATNAPGVTVEPISVGENFLAECPQYGPLTDLLSSRGWHTNTNLRCLPYDYRFPPGENSFLDDLRSVVETSVSEAKGTKVVIACHSQGCLMADYALRTLDATWVSDHVSSLFGFAGQFSGCSDCMRWAFSDRWSWDRNDQNASPVDPTWVGQMGLDLQESVYGENILYKVGAREYRAADNEALLASGGAISMARATKRYGLQRQDWYASGDERGQPLPIPGRFVYGSNLPTTVGYTYSVPISSAGCTTPQCAGLLSQASVAEIQSDGDGGDSAWMNEAPGRWTTDVQCDLRSLPGISHMAIVTNSDAIDLLIRVAREGISGDVPCVSS
ncbi:MAG: hypothetical protein QNL59_10925 [Actinomycetota bacterium]